MSKQIYDPSKNWVFRNTDNNLIAVYIAQLVADSEYNLRELNKIKYTRVEYISRFGKANRTPRYTWCYGKVDSNIVTYEKHGKKLNFQTEEMPKFLKDLSVYCRNISRYNWKCVGYDGKKNPILVENENHDLSIGFDPEYNSCIIGMYEDRDDSIGFHFDTETFLKHHFCANVTFGYSRDFQFKDDSRTTHEIKLGNNSLFFFLGLEHALPKRAAVKKGERRFSISFRNMCKDVGIANSYYYSRGLDGAIDDECRKSYSNKLESLKE